MALIDYLQTVMDRDSFAIFVTELIKEKNATAKSDGGVEASNKAVTLYFHSALAWASSSSMHRLHGSNDAVIWRKYATDLFCRKLPV